MCSMRTFTRFFFDAAIVAKIEQQTAETVIEMVVHADDDVFQQAHFLEHANVLEGARDAAFGDLVGRDLADVLTIKRDAAR